MEEMDLSDDEGEYMVHVIPAVAEKDTETSGEKQVVKKHSYLEKNQYQVQTTTGTTATND
jgi:hypothetical protein